MLCLKMSLDETELQGVDSSLQVEYIVLLELFVENLYLLHYIVSFLLI